MRLYDVISVPPIRSLPGSVVPRNHGSGGNDRSQHDRADCSFLEVFSSEKVQLSELFICRVFRSCICPRCDSELFPVVSSSTVLLLGRFGCLPRSICRNCVQIWWLPPSLAPVIQRGLQSKLGYVQEFNCVSLKFAFSILFLSC